ncbi:MAG TPA: transporter substrate-binding domain-containing protein, partial [Cellvibrionaceae bacterium]
MALSRYWLVFKSYRAVFSYRRTLFGVFLIGICLTLTGSRTPSMLERVLAAGEIRVLSRNGPTTWYEDSNGTTGFEYTLMQGFADSLGVKLVIEDQENLSHMLTQVTRDEAHFAAAGLTVTPDRQKWVKFTQPYHAVTQQLIYNHNQPKPGSVDDLVDSDILVIAGSSHAERLQQLRREHPALNWDEQHNL